jgi:hypothetical protein
MGAAPVRGAGGGAIGAAWDGAGTEADPADFTGYSIDLLSETVFAAPARELR